MSIGGAATAGWASGFLLIIMGLTTVVGCVTFCFIGWAAFSSCFLASGVVSWTLGGGSVFWGCSGDCLICFALSIKPKLISNIGVFGDYVASFLLGVFNLLCFIYSLTSAFFSGCFTVGELITGYYCTRTCWAVFISYLRSIILGILIASFTFSVKPCDVYCISCCFCWVTIFGLAGCLYCFATSTSGMPLIMGLSGGVGESANVGEFCFGCWSISWSMRFVLFFNIGWSFGLSSWSSSSSSVSFSSGESAILLSSYGGW